MDGHNSENEPIIGYDELNGEEKPVFFLGHSCDEWIIGDIEQAKEFHKLIGEIINKVERNPDYRKDGYEQWG